MIAGAPKSMRAKGSTPQFIERVGFQQGVKAQADPSLCPPDGVWEARNIRGDLSGLLRLRPGSVNLNASLGNGTVQGMLPAFGALLVVWNQNLYSVNLSTGAATLVTSGVFGKTASAPVPMVNWTSGGAEMVYLWSGAGLYQYSGSGNAVLVTPSTPPAGQASNLLGTNPTQTTTSEPATATCAVLRTGSSGQRLACAYGNDVLLCSPLDATYWPSDEVIHLPDDGGTITGLAVYYDALVVFRDRDVWAFFGTDAKDTSATLTLQDGQAGCQASATAVEVPGVGLCYLGPDNVYAIQALQTVTTRFAAQPIGDDVRRFLVQAMTQGTAGASASYFGRQYRLSIPSSVQSERVFVLDMQSGSPKRWIDTGPATAKAGADFDIGTSAIGVGAIGRTQPVVPYESRLSPAPKGHFAQLEVMGFTTGEDFGLLGYGIEFVPASKQIGARSSVTP